MSKVDKPKPVKGYKKRRVSQWTNDSSDYPKKQESDLQNWTFLEPVRIKKVAKKSSSHFKRSLELHNYIAAAKLSVNEPIIIKKKSKRKKVKLILPLASFQAT